MNRVRHSWSRRWLWWFSSVNLLWLCSTKRWWVDRKVKFRSICIFVDLFKHFELREFSLVNLQLLLGSLVPVLTTCDSFDFLLLSVLLSFFHLLNLLLELVWFQARDWISSEDGLRFQELIAERVGAFYGSLRVLFWDGAEGAVILRCLFVNLFHVPLQPWRLYQIPISLRLTWLPHPALFMDRVQVDYLC